VAGSGIGLAVVKGLTDLHGGRVWVEDSVREGNAGARFVVSLPEAWRGEDPADGHL